MKDHAHSALAEITLTEMKGEPRARDLDIAKRLGFDRPRKIRDLIKAHAAELETFGSLTLHAGASKSGRGRVMETIEFWLNEEQALLIATLSDAPNAPAVRAMLIKTFVVWRRGHLGAFEVTVNGLSAEVRSAIGGIIKGIVHREVAILIPEAVEAALVTDTRRAVAERVSVKQLLDESKVPSKGRNSINRKIGRELQARALEVTSRGEPSPHRRCAHTATWLYGRDFAEQFMRERGRRLVADHLAWLMGQTVIPFPVTPKKPEGGSAPARDSAS